MEAPISLTVDHHARQTGEFYFGTFGENQIGIDIRHFFASWCINPKDRGGRELPPKEAQRLLGHSSIVMTLDIYGRLFPGGGDRAELARASSMLLGSPPPADNVVALVRD
jgi:hypothetical protein